MASNSLTLAHHFVSIKLTARNYLFWRTQMVPFLRGQGLLGVSSSFTRDAWFNQDQAILSMLIFSLFEETMHLVVGRATSWQL